MGGRKQPYAKRITDDDESHWLRDGISNIWREYQWFIIAGLWFMALVLGYLGFHHHLGKEASPLRLLHLTVQLFVLESGDVVKGNLAWTLETARILAPMVAAYTALKAITVVFYDQVQMIRLRFINNHVVICGLGRIGTLLAMEYRRMGLRVVVIEKDEGNDNIQQAKDRKVIILIGDASDPVMLKKARIDVAEYLIAGTGDDSLNAEIAWQVRMLVESRRNDPLNCLIHIASSRVYSLLSEHPVMTVEGIDTFRLCPFNIRAIGAQLLLNEHPPFGWDAVDKDKGGQPHILILGLGRFGEAMVVEMAIRWRLLSPGVKLRLKVIDRVATERVGNLIHHFPSVDDICDLELYDFDFEKKEFRDAEFLFEKGELVTNLIYVCVDDDKLGLATTLTLDKKAGSDVRIIVRTSHDKGLTRLISGVRKSVRSDLMAFELFERACKPDQLGCFSERLAFEFHKGYIEDTSDEDDEKKKTSEAKRKRPSEIEPALKEWQGLPASLKLSNLRQADSTGRVLALAGFEMVPVDFDLKERATLTDEDIEKIARLEHERFVADRIRDGWKDGPRDPKNKKSPYLVPWNQLDEDTKETDRKWARRLPNALDKVGLMICRMNCSGKSANGSQTG